MKFPRGWRLRILANINVDLLLISVWKPGGFLPDSSKFVAGTAGPRHDGIRIRWLQIPTRSATFRSGISAFGWWHGSIKGGPDLVVVFELQKATKLRVGRDFFRGFLTLKTKVFFRRVLRSPLKKQQHSFLLVDTFGLEDPCLRTIHVDLARRGHVTVPRRPERGFF